MVDSTRMFDLIVIGAGISGINCAYRLQNELPHIQFTVLEGRGSLGGTWDLFKFPGVRSDSDLLTYGFSWKPWPYSHPVAEAPLILQYLKTCVSQNELDQYIQYKHKVLSMKWSSKTQKWTLVVNHEGVVKMFTARFVFLGVGYYDYQTPRQTTIPGIENFQGKVIHPQFWPEGYDYTGQKMAIIGSGATAVTLLPALAKKASVTLVQRSPTYIRSIMNRTPPCSWLPGAWRRWWRVVIVGVAAFYCKYFPTHARNDLRKAAAAQLPTSISIDPHFSPRYSPWEQRLCVAPDGDFYRAFHDPNTHVVTGRVKQVTQRAIEMEDGQVIEADAIVTATGHRMELGGKIDISVDGKTMKWKGMTVWNGCMIQDIPNMMFSFGYANASWTLGAESTTIVLIRLWKFMENRRIAAAVPRISEKAIMEDVKFWPLSSTYSQEAEENLPKYGSTGPWRPRITPIMDYVHARWGDITTGLQFST